jgi:hypothetical protein
MHIADASFLRRAVCPAGIAPADKGFRVGMQARVDILLVDAAAETDRIDFILTPRVIEIDDREALHPRFARILQRCVIEIDHGSIAILAQS